MSRPGAAPIPGILPEEYLAGLSVTRQASVSTTGKSAPVAGVYVAIASGQDVPRGGWAKRLVGYTTVGRNARMTLPGGSMDADGEIETLYVLDDWRERGVGRRLIRTGAAHLAAAGSRAAFLWVLRNNPSRWFYQRLGGRAVAECEHARSPAFRCRRLAYAWDPIERLIAASPAA